MKFVTLLSSVMVSTVVVAAPTPIASPPSLERLYSLPWVIGSTPEKPAWSPDSRHVAFLWSEAGTNTRDLWIADTAGHPAVRLSPVAATAAFTVPANADRQVALQATAARERDPGVTSFTFTAAGDALVYTRQDALYRVPTAGSAPATRLMATVAGAHELTAVPTSTLIAYTDAHGLKLVDTAASAPVVRTLVHVPDDVMVESFRLSPDGRQIAFLEADTRAIPERIIPDYLGAETQAPTIRRAFPGEPSERYRVGVVATAGGDPVWMDLDGAPDDLVFSIAWSPDGRHLLVDRSDLYIKHRWLRVLDPSTGTGRTPYEERDAANVTAEWWADWAPDGRSVFLTSDRDADYQLWQIPLNGAEPTPLTDGRAAVFSAAVVPAAHGILYISNRSQPEDRQPYFLPFGGQPVALSQDPGYHEPIASPDGQWLAEIDSSDGTPPELYLRRLNVRGGSEPARRVTHSPLPEYEQYPWAVAHYVDFPNVHDGTLVHARLTLPPDFDPHRHYPAIIGSVYSNTAHNRFGGRIYHPTWALDQYLVRHGYVIMNVDISGSSGHGKGFRQRIREDYGGVDVEDLYSATRYLAATGYIDEKRIGLWGSSYGGLLTTMSLMKHPGTYAAGVAGAPATNVFHAETGEMRTMMDPVSRAERYRAASPFLYSDGLQDPLLFIHGMRDDTVLLKDTLTLAQRLILADKNFEMAVLPDAPHGWDTQGLAQTRYAFRRLVEFFDRYLKPDAVN